MPNWHAETAARGGHDETTLDAACLRLTRIQYRMSPIETIFADSGLTARNLAPQSCDQSRITCTAHEFDAHNLPLRPCHPRADGGLNTPSLALRPCNQSRITCTAREFDASNLPLRPCDRCADVRFGVCGRAPRASHENEITAPYCAHNLAPCPAAQDETARPNSGFDSHKLTLRPLDQTGITPTDNKLDSNNRALRPHGARRNRFGARNHARWPSDQAEIVAPDSGLNARDLAPRPRDQTGLTCTAPEFDAHSLPLRPCDPYADGRFGVCGRAPRASDKNAITLHYGGFDAHNLAPRPAAQDETTCANSRFDAHSLLLRRCDPCADGRLNARGLTLRPSYQTEITCTAPEFDARDLTQQQCDADKPMTQLIRRPPVSTRPTARSGFGGR